MWKILVKMAFRSFFTVGISHFLSAKMDVTSCITEGYKSTIIADMKMRASYNISTAVDITVKIIADMKMRASYNTFRFTIGSTDIIADMKMRASYNTF